jgi:hypothetical protein
LNIEYLSLPSGLEAYEAYGLEAGSQILQLGEEFFQFLLTYIKLTERSDIHKSSIFIRHSSIQEGFNIAKSIFALSGSYR